MRSRRIDCTYTTKTKSSCVGKQSNLQTTLPMEPENGFEVENEPETQAEKKKTADHVTGQFQSVKSNAHR